MFFLHRVAIRIYNILTYQKKKEYVLVTIFFFLIAKGNLIEVSFVHMGPILHHPLITNPSDAREI